MKKFCPLSLSIQNFRSVGEETTIDFESLSSLTLIKGINNDVTVDGEDVDKPNNGAGKSTIIDAMLFALYGRTLRNVNNAKIINRSIGNKLKTFCRLKFRLDDDVYVSEAFLKSGGKNPSIGFVLQKNDEKPLDRNTPQMKELIEEQILGCPYDLFKSSIVISQSSYQNFYEMTKAEKVAYIEQLFHLTDFGAILKMVRSDLNATKMEFNTANMNIGRIGERLHELMSKNDRFEEENNGRTDALKTAISLKQMAIKNCESEALKYAALPNRSEKEKEQMLLKDNIEAKRNALMTYNSAISVLETKISESKKLLGKHSEVIDIICNDCKNKVSEVLNLNNIRNSVAEFESKLSIVKSAVEKTKKECSELEERSLELSHEIEKIRDSERKRMLNENQLTYLKNELETLEKQLQEAQERENPFTDLIIKVKKEIEDANSTISVKAQEIKKLQLMELAFGDSGAKKDILADLAQLVNNLMKSYLKQLGSDYSVVFSPNFDFEFITPDGVSTIDEFSSGERQRISLATMFSFRDLITGNRILSDLCILDECIDSGIDQFGINRIIESIYKMSVKSKIKFAVVSHNKAVSDKLEKYREDGNSISVLTAVKTDRKTHYEIES